jgi:lysozyme
LSKKSRLQKLAKKWKLITLFLVLALLAALLTTVFTEKFWPNTLFASAYPVQGLDVSSYQKEVDWKTVAQSNAYSFVFIKATEGKNYKDAYFATNWRETKAHGLLRGAYHFYRENRTAAEQAANFISMVPREKGMLPPVIDLEVSGQDHDAPLLELRLLLHLLEEHYQIKPIIYTDAERYREYVRGNFDEYTIWYRDIFLPVQITGARWSFWQYCSRCHIADIVGSCRSEHLCRNKRAASQVDPLSCSQLPYLVVCCFLSRQNAHRITRTNPPASQNARQDACIEAGAPLILPHNSLQ